MELPPKALEVFNTLKMKCMTAPVLAIADFEKPFLLETDASSHSLGALLLQKQVNNKYHPVANASQELKGGEKKYHSSKLEFLALKWAVTDQFKEYLWNKPFTVHTDNNPLTYQTYQKIDEDIILHAHQMVKHDKQFRNLMNQNWVHTQMQDPIISNVINWIP